MKYTKIKLEDIKPKIEYWESAVGCYALGASPPYRVLIGFIRRIWAEYKIEKIVTLKNGIILVKFDSIVTRDAVMQRGFYHFDKKPLL